MGIDAWEGEPFNMILELKAVKDAIKTDHYWQLLSYMNYKKCDYGAVINFNQGIDGQPLELAFLVRHEGSVYIYKLQTGQAILMKTTDYEAEAIEGRAIDESLNGTTKKKAPKDEKAAELKEAKANKAEQEKAAKTLLSMKKTKNIKIDENGEPAPKRKKV